MNCGFCFLQPKGLPRRFTPVLVGLREEVVDGAYTLVSLLFTFTIEPHNSAPVRGSVSMWLCPLPVSK